MKIMPNSPWKPLQSALSLVGIGAALTHAVPTFAEGLEAKLPNLERDTLTLIADAHPTRDGATRERYFCKEINERATQWNGDGSIATTPSIDALEPSKWSEWDDPNAAQKLADYRAECRALNTGGRPPHFVNIQKETWHRN
jgi:hypothetical protein